MVETPHAHPFGGFRIPPGILAAAKPPPEFARIKYTESQIAEALISIASGILHQGLNRSQALNCAGALSVYVNDPRNTNFAAGGNLEANPAFSSLVAEKAPLLAMAASDPETAKAKARAELEQHNASAGPLSPAAQNLANWTRFGQPVRGGGSSGGTSARFDAMESSSSSSISPHSSAYWSTPAGMDHMRNYAVQQGVPWAAGNPELLRLGPAAIESFAKVQMQKETYEKLTKKIGFTGREAVNEVNYYLRNGGDPTKHKEHVDEMEKNLLGLTGGDPEAMRKAREAISGLTTSKGTEADKQTFNDKINAIAGSDPAKQDAGQALGKQFKTTSDQTHAKEAKAEGKELKADTKEVKAETKVTQDKNATAGAEAVFGAGGKEAAAPERPATASKDKVPAGPAPGK